MTGVCGVAIIVWSGVADRLEAVETTPCEDPACSKCYDALVEELIEEEPLEAALDRGYEPIVIED